MGDTIRKAFSFQVKEIKDRVLEFTGSTETMDRDGEVVKADGWDLKNYKNNPVVLFGHDYGSLPVAKCIKAWVEGGQLKFQDQFPTAEEYPYADTVYKLCKGGYLNTVSVGFIPLKSEPGKNGVRKVWVKQELLEHSIVPVPSNPDALRNAVDSHVITAKEFKEISKPAVKDFTEEFNHELQEGAIWKMIDTLCCCIRDAMCDSEDMAKAKTIQAIGDAFSLSFAKWVKDANKAGVFDEVDSDEGMPDVQQYANRNSTTKKPTQGELKDQLDYTLAIIGKSGISDDSKEMAVNLVVEINKRLLGSDIPINIKSAAIRSVDSARAVIKMMSDHHTAHMVAYDSMNKSMMDLAKSLENGDSGNQPATPLGQGQQNLAVQAEERETQEFMTNEIKRILGGKSCL